MATRITFADAKTAYERLVTSVIPIATAIQEAVNLYYDMGRWPGTTVELELADADFVYDEDREAYIVSIDETLYDGVLGFRNATRGWNIRGQLCLYRDKLNAGDLDFIDLETVVDSTSTTSAAVAASVVLGAGAANTQVTLTCKTAGAAGNLYNAVILASTGSPSIMGLSMDGNQVVITARSCTATHVVSGFVGIGVVYDLFTATYGGDGAGTVGDVAPTDFTGGLDAVLADVVSRKYRCPLGFVPEYGPYYALCKLDAPQLVNDTDIVPIPSTAALKALIMAVSYETANDPARQEAAMQTFERVMSRASREIQGRRAMPLMTTTTMRSKPQQFP